MSDRDAEEVVGKDIKTSLDPENLSTKHLLRSVCPIQDPKIFNARGVLHCGHVQSSQDASKRYVLVAFTTLYCSTLIPEIRLLFRKFGFNHSGESCGKPKPPKEMIGGKPLVFTYIKDDGWQKDLVGGQSYLQTLK